MTFSRSSGVIYRGIRMSKKRKKKKINKKKAEMARVDEITPVEKEEPDTPDEAAESVAPDEAEALDDPDEAAAAEDPEVIDDPEDTEDTEDTEDAGDEPEEAEEDPDEAEEETEEIEETEETEEEPEQEEMDPSADDDSVLAALAGGVAAAAPAEKRKYTRSDDIMKDFTDSYEEFMSTFEKKSKHKSDQADGSGEDQGSGHGAFHRGAAGRRHRGETPEEREARFEIRRKQQRRRRRIIALCVVIAALAAIGGVAVSHFSSAYNNDKDFQNFADKQYQKMKKLPPASDRLVTYEYDDGISYAYRYDPSDNEDLAVFRDQRVAEMKKKFSKAVAKEMDEDKDSAGGLLGRNTHHAMLFDSAVYDTGNGALSMAIYAVKYEEDGGKMKSMGSAIQTYLLDPDTMRALNPMQVLMPEYKEKTSDFVREYFDKNFKDDEIREGAEAYLKEDDANYNLILLSRGDMTVYFKEGTVLDDSEGVVPVKVPKSYLGATLRGQMIERYIDPEKPMVAITYDDGPGLKSEKRIIKCLRKHDAVATFFYVGARVGNDEENVRNAYKIGCEIGNHSWDHSDLTGLSKAGVRSQLTRTDKAIKKVIGVTPDLYRPPYGSYNQTVLNASNMPAILWTVDTMDWSSRDAGAVFNVVKNVKKLDGKIILMHSIYDSTAKATEKIVPYLLKNGYQLVTVSELIKYKSGEAPQGGEVYMSGKH